MGISKIDSKHLFDVNPYIMYASLHQVKGTYNDEEFFTKVKDYYLNEAKNKLKKIGFNSICPLGKITNNDINSLEDLSILIENTNLVYSLFDVLQKYIDNKNFTLFENYVPKGTKFISQEMTQWLSSTKDLIKNLPDDNLYYSNDIIKNNWIAIKGKLKTDIIISDELEEEIKDYIHNEKFYINQESAPAVSHIIKYVEGSKEYNNAIKDEYLNDILRVFLAKHSCSASNNSLVLEQMKSIIKSYINIEASQVRAENKQKNISLLIGIITYPLFFLILFLLKDFAYIINDLFTRPDTYIQVSTNIWKTLVGIVLSLFVVTFLFDLAARGCKKRIVPFLPRYSTALVIYYLTFHVEYTYPLVPKDTYLIPIYIIGFFCVLSSFVIDSIDFHKTNTVKDSMVSNFQTVFRSKNRGLIFFTSISSILPLLVFVSFLFIVSQLQIISIWVFVIEYMILMGTLMATVNLGGNKNGK